MLRYSARERHPAVYLQIYRYASLGSGDSLPKDYYAFKEGFGKGLGVLGREIAAMTAIKSAHVMPIEAIVLDRCEKLRGFIMPLADGGTLAQVRSRQVSAGLMFARTSSSKPLIP